MKPMLATRIATTAEAITGINDPRGIEVHPKHR
jgi:hypothetical protein